MTIDKSIQYLIGVYLGGEPTLELVQPFFSIIIPVYNSSMYIERCIDSILIQEFSDFEIILVDDGSTDDSVEIVSKYIKEYPFIKLLRQSNQGVSTARNWGIETANGKYLLFIDADDYWINATMSKLHEILTTNRNVDILFFNYSEASDESQKLHEILPSFIGDRISKEKAIKGILSNKGYLGYCWNKVFKKSVVQNCRFDESITYLEDMLFNVSCILNAIEIMSIDDCLYAYNLRSDSVVNTFNPKHMTFFDSLDKISDLIPNEFSDAITIKKRLACIEFASSFVFTNKNEYEIFKKKFYQQKRIFGLNRFGLGKQEQLVLSLGNVSFLISVIGLQLIKKIKRS